MWGGNQGEHDGEEGKVPVIQERYRGFDLPQDPYPAELKLNTQIYLPKAWLKLSIS